MLLENDNIQTLGHRQTETDIDRGTEALGHGDSETGRYNDSLAHRDNYIQT